MSKRNSQRIAYGEELVALGAKNENIVTLEADLGKSTMSYLFKEAYPERYFEMGIAEQNMLSTAAGLAVSGKIAFASTFAVFASGRAFDQIRQTIAIGNLNVKICGSSSGLSDFGDGSTHQAIEDIATMSVIPNMTVFAPCDATETRQMVRAAAEIDGPVYIRVVRNDVLDYITEDDKFEIGRMKVLKEGDDVVIFANGTMVEESMKAADILKADGISAKVVNVSTMKPFNEAGVIELSKGMKAVVTAEEHSYIGGLASKVALALKKSTIPMDYVAVDDKFGQSAHDVNQLMEHYGLTAKDIVEKTKGLL